MTNPLSREQVSRLAECARQGDREAFEDLVKRYHGPFKGYILTRTSGDESLAEDALQQVWLDIWRELRKTAEEGGFDADKASFYTYVINRFVKFKVRQIREESTKMSREGSPVQREDPKMQIDPLGGREASPPEQRLSMTEDLEEQLRVYCELFRILFLCGGYPHQQMAFGFSKHLYGKTNDSTLEGKPERVARENGGLPLETLLREYWELYRAQSSIDDEQILRDLRRSLEPVRDRMAVKVRELTARDKASQKQLEDLLEKTVAATCLHDYYATRRGGFSTAIPGWCFRVEERVRTVLNTGSKACGRCKLRDLRPCSKNRSGK